MVKLPGKSVIGVIAALTAAIFASMLGLAGCTPKDPSGITGTDGVGGSAQSNKSGLASFSFSDFNAFGDGSYTARVKTLDDGRIVVTYDIFGYQDLDEFPVYADETLLKDLEAVYLEQNIARWNGFDKVDQRVLDGGGFGLNMAFVDGKELSAHGSNVYPDGFGAFQKRVESILEPYRTIILEESRKTEIERGTKGSLDTVAVNFTQHGTSGHDEYSFFISTDEFRDKNFDVSIKSDGEYFPQGKIRYYCALPDEAIWFGRIQELIDKHHVLQWHRWDKTADDYNNAEWFQIDFTYSEDGYIDAMGTLHPEGYEEFRADFLQLMADMVKNAEANYGLSPYE